jgi:hypothetical protein
MHLNGRNLLIGCYEFAANVDLIRYIWNRLAVTSAKFNTDHMTKALMRSVAGRPNCLPTLASKLI